MRWSGALTAKVLDRTYRIGAREHARARGSPLIHPFDNRGDALADADAHGGEAVAAAAFFHFVNKRRHDPGAAAAQRVAEGDGAAVDVELIEIDAQLARAREHLRRKGFVDFNEVDLLDGEAGAFERFLRRRYRSDSHVVWMNTGGGRRDDARHRLELSVARLFAVS